SSSRRHLVFANARWSVTLTAMWTDSARVGLAQARHLAHRTQMPRHGYAQPLRPFSLEDTRNYISFHLQRVDADLELFSDPAIQRIFQATRGRPRYINQLCLYLLIQAAISGIDTIDGDFAAAQIAAHPFYQQPPEA
ncbi:hypothetical protein KJ682_13870, partial [bacterium]|nr:hypothetical protein [bacterium]